MALGNTGLTTSLIGNTLGVSSRDVGTLCTSSNINIFSYYKPHNSLVASYSSRPATTAKGGLIYDNVNKKLKWDKPTGGSSSPYRMGDFAGYDHNAKELSIDYTKLRATADVSKSSMNVTIEPSFADSKFNWGTILGGYTTNNLVIKAEVYNQSNTLMGSSSFKIGEIDSTGKVSLNVANKTKKTDTKIYVKGYFCDYSGNVLCPFIDKKGNETTVEKPLTVTQSKYFYIGKITVNNSSFKVAARLQNGEGAYDTKLVIDITNNGSSDYVAGSNFPNLYVKFRALDGSYTSSNISVGRLTSCTNIPKYTTRTQTISAGSEPTYGSVTKWYIDVDVRMQ